jgi:hypothetical protein
MYAQCIENKDVKDLSAVFSISYQIKQCLLQTYIIALHDRRVIGYSHATHL